MKKIGILVAVVILAVAVLASPTLPYSANVVAKQSLTGQTAAIAPTTLITPTNDQDYLVTMYLITSNASGGGTNYLGSILWTDDFNSYVSNQVDSYTTTQGAASWVVHAAAGTPVQFQVQLEINNGFDPYDVFVTVVKL